MKQAHLRDIFKTCSKRVCTPARPTVSHPIHFFSYEVEAGSDDPQPADEGDIQMEYSCD